MLQIVKPDEIDSVIGKDLGASEWMVIDQERIDKFADATMDYQFIHVDPNRQNLFLVQQLLMDFFHYLLLLESLLNKK